MGRSKACRARRMAIMWRCKPCAEPACKELAEQGAAFCKKHSKQNYRVEAARVQRENAPWKKWYCLAGWKSLRNIILSRDYMCQICKERISTVCDHIKPHRGNWNMFIDPANLQGLCEPCHDRKTALEDGGFGNVRKGHPSHGTDQLESVRRLQRRTVQ